MAAKSKTVVDKSYVRTGAISKRKQHQTQPQLTETDYITIFENSSVAITLADENENIIYWNRFAESLLGMNANELYMKPVSSLYPEAEWRRIRSQNVRQKGMQHHIETQIIKKNQEIIDVDLSLSVLKGPDGNVTGSIGIMADITRRITIEEELRAQRDHLDELVKARTAELTRANRELQREISERKQAQEALRESRDQLKQYFEGIPDAIYINDVNGTFLYGNKAAERMTGYAREELVGNNFLEAGLLPPEYLPKAARIRELNAGGRPTGPDEVELIRKDGSRVLAEISTYPVGEGKGTETIGIARDITERKQSEEALRESEERFRKVLDNSIDMVYRLDLQTGRYDYISPSSKKMLGYTPEEFKSLGIEKATPLVHPDDVDKLMENIIKLITSPEQKDTASTVEYRLKHRKLGYRWMSDNRSVVYDEMNVPVAVVGNLRDITEQKIVEEALQQREQDYSVLVESIYDGIAVVDVETLNIVFGNRRAAKMFGFDQILKDGVGINLLEFVHPEDKDIVIKGFAEDFYQTDRRKRYEVRAKTNDGRDIWVSALATRIEFQGRLAVLLSVADLTERKWMEEELRIKENAIDNSLSAVAMYDVEGKITYANQAFMKLWGWDKKEELLGKPYWMFFKSDEVVKDIAGAMIKRQAWEGELVARRRDGKEVLVHVFSAIVNDNLGNPVQTISSFTDITERKTAEEALRESEEKLRNVLDSSLDMVYRLNLDTGTYEYLSPSSKQLLGYSPEEFIALGPEHAASLIHPDDAERLSENIVKLMASIKKDERASIIEYQIKHKELGYRWVADNISVIREDADKPILVVGNLRDITERKTAEKALLESEKKFRRLVEEMNDGYCVLQGSRVVFANARSAEMFGYIPEDVTDKTVQELLPPEIVDELLKMRLMRQSGGTMPEQYETTLISKDGMPLIVELGTRVIEYAGKPALSVVIRDVTKRKQAEEALRHSEEYFRALTENVLDVIVVLNRDASVRYKSPSFEQMVGKDRAGKEPFEFVHPDDITNATETFAQLTQNPGATVHTEIRGEHRDSSWHTFEVIGKNLLDDPAVAGIVANFRDITERKLAEQEVHRLNEELEQRVIERTTQLEAVNKELEAFAYSVSHDLRAPLRSIDGFSQILMEDYTDKLDDEGKDHLHRVRSASQRMGELIDDILSLSRVTRGEMRYEAVDLSALAETICAELQQSQTERQAEFIITPEIVTEGDSHLLRAALDNLLGNAWKFTKMRTPARLEFGTIENNDQLVYFIRDNGVGFDMAYADKLFGAFQRLHSPSEFEGTGIGLATVQRIIHRHGGRIWAESVVDQGTTFYFTLNDERGAK